MRSVAAAYAVSSTQRSLFARTQVLTGRSHAGLQQTQALVEAAAVSCVCIQSVYDMEELESIQPAWETSVAAAAAAAPGGFRRAILVNNAGSLGDLRPISDLPSVLALRRTIDSNVTACIWLTSLFLRWLGGADGLRPSPHAPPSAVVNVSSLAAIEPFATMLVYCAGKAARDMLHKGVAEEAALATAAGTLPVAVKTLNYAPGPMDTDMQGELASSATLLAESRAYFASLKAEGKLVVPDDSAAKCARLLASDAFVSGSHVDFYDAESTV